MTGRWFETAVSMTRVGPPMMARQASSMASGSASALTKAFAVPRRYDPDGDVGAHQLRTRFRDRAVTSRDDHGVDLFRHGPCGKSARAPLRGRQKDV